MTCAKLRHHLKPRVISKPRTEFERAVATVDLVLEYLGFESEHAKTPEDGSEDLRSVIDTQFKLYQAISTTNHVVSKSG